MNNSLPTNSSHIPRMDDDIEYDHGVLVAFTVIMAMLTITLTVGNIFVITALVAVRPMRSASDHLTVNLCASGAILGLIVMPYGTMTTYLRYPVWGEGVCQAMAFIKMTSMYSTNLTLMAIGIDRYIKVKQTTIPRLRFTKTWILITAIWIVSLVSATPPLVGWGWYHWVQQKPICTNDWIASTTYTLFLVIVFSSIPLIIVFYCYGSIVRIVVQSRRRLDVHRRRNAENNDTAVGADSLETQSEHIAGSVEPVRWAIRTDRAANLLGVSVADGPSSHHCRNAVGPEPFSCPVPRPAPDIKPIRPVNRADIAVIRTMIIVLSTYVIFWYPYIICMLIKITNKERLSFIVETVTIELALLGMAFNPVIYAVSNKGFRRDLKTAFKKVYKPKR